MMTTIRLVKKNGNVLEPILVSGGRIAISHGRGDRTYLHGLLAGEEDGVETQTTWRISSANIAAIELTAEGVEA